jgi:CheY-like chemotaxis protein
MASTIRAVVCDDDPVVRSVVAELAAETGLEVVAETDRGGDVIELVRRFGIDVVILDLSMGIVSGHAVTAGLRAERLDTVIVVFTAYASARSELEALGVLAVVEKPDFEGLRAALGEAVEVVRARVAGPSVPDEGDRRAATREVPEGPPAWRSPSGIEAAGALGGLLAVCSEGDAVLAVSVGDHEWLAEAHGDLLAADCALEPGRALRAAARTQDHVVHEPRCSGFVAVLRGGDDRAAEAVWRRLATRLERLKTVPPVTAAWALVDHETTPAEAFARAVGTAASMVTPGLQKA